MRLGFHCVHEVGELHRVLDEEHGHVVAHQVPVAFVGVELHREAAHVARGVLRAALALHGREAHEDRRDLALRLERRRARDVGQRRVALEEAVRAAAARVHDAFGNALVVEVRDLLAQDEVLQQCGPRRPAFSECWLSETGTPWLVVMRRALASVRTRIQRTDGDRFALGRPRTELVGRVDLAQRARADVVARRFDALAFLRRVRVVVAVFERLVRVERHRFGCRIDVGRAFGDAITRAFRYSARHCRYRYCVRRRDRRCGKRAWKTAACDGPWVDLDAWTRRLRSAS